MTVGKLLLMAGLHFVVMYFLMYSMVNTWDNVFFNINNVYMAGIMTAPMVIFEGFLMGSMYKNKKLLKIIMILSGLVLVLFFLFIRAQSWVNDREFLRSMIPHHSGAILMCEESQLEDQEIQDLCRSIIQSQQEEIDQMKEIMERIN